MNSRNQLAGGLTLSGLQTMILQMYGEKDAARGDAATFLWLTEEFGELATALRSGTTMSWPRKWPTCSPGWRPWPISAGSISRRPSCGNTGLPVRAAVACHAYATRPRNRSDINICHRDRHIP